MQEFILIPLDQFKALLKEVLTEHHNSQPASQPTQLTVKESYTSKDLQTLFNVSGPTIWAWERKSLLRPVIVGRKKTYLGKDIATLIESKQLNKRG
jgi:hypothetical protein